MEYADNIFIINLEKHTDRWQKIEKELEKYPIRYQRFEGVYGKDLDPEYITQKTSWLARNFLINYATVGCYLSHFNLWKKLLQDENNDFYLVFEDDFVIRNFQGLNKLYKLFREGKIDEKIDYLSIYDNGVQNCEYLQDDASPLKKPEFIYDDIIIGKKRFPLTCLGYFITKKGASKLVPKLEKIKYHIDFYLALLNLFDKEVNIYNVQNNLLCIPESGFVSSSINENQKRTIFYYLLSYNKYFGFQYPAIVYKLDKPFSIEFVFSIILAILFLFLFVKSKIPPIKILYFSLFLLSLTNSFLCLS